MEPKHLSETLEEINLRGPKQALSEADNKFQGNAEPAAILKSEKRSLSRTMDGSKTGDVTEVLPIPVAFSPKKK